MGTWFRSWWQQHIKQHSVRAVLIALLAVVIVLVILGGYQFNWDWTGFNRPSKTLWDWLQLLGVFAIPVVVGLGAVWFTARQNYDREQAYMDKMSELLLKGNLGELTTDGKLKPEYKQVRNIARAHTFIVLSGLDAGRKRIILKFLYESGLIDKDGTIIGLNGANLRNADLHREWWHKANLHGVLLLKADLSEANLMSANLSRAELTKANLSRANLSGANLSGANLHGADLHDAKYNRAEMQELDPQGKPVLDEKGQPVIIGVTQWPQGFDPKAAGAICVDC